MSNNGNIDAILNRISLAFSTDSVNMVFPEDLLVELSLYQISKIDPIDLDNELIYHAKLYTLFTSILSYVSDKYVRMDAFAKTLDAQLSMRYEKSIVAAGERVSDKKLEKLVDADSEYIDIVNQKLTFKNMVNVFSGIVSSLENKRDMLLQISAKRRAEMKEGL